jgi:hypothetical protein
MRGAIDGCNIGGRVGVGSANVLYVVCCAGAFSVVGGDIIGRGKNPQVASALSLAGRWEPIKTVVHGARAVQFVMRRPARPEFKEDR